MLKASHPLARRFQQHAFVARQHALETSSYLLRERYLTTERWWLKLAESYDFSSRVDRLIVDRAKAPDVEICGR
jgi:hypothetical protein